MTSFNTRIYLHETFALQLVHPVGSAVKPLPLRVQHRVHHLPPGLTVDQQSHPHHAARGNQHSVHRTVLPVRIDDGQQSQTGKQARQDEEEKDEGWNAARLLPLPLA